MRIGLRFVVAVATILGSMEAANALVRVDVDLSTQTMRVASGSGESFEWPISSGRKGHLTPTGWYRPIGLYTMVHSAKYDNAPMPHSIFFLSQYAIHGTAAVGSLGRPASHGCIRLAPGNAATLFAMVKAEGATIRISGQIPSSRLEVARRERARASSALGYAPLPLTRTLKEWARDPFAGF
jgi:lipoprotein-anchoring transpeptidase ErfK/SrfK